jgi:hypothetical protein
MEKDRQETLEWFVQFANMDLEEIKPGDQLKLIVESGEYLFPKKEWEELRKIPTKSIPGDLAPHLISQTMYEKGLGRMDWVFDELKEPNLNALRNRLSALQTSEYWAQIRLLQTTCKLIFEANSRASSNGSLIVLPFRTEIIGIFKGGPGKQPFRLTYLPITGTQEEYIQLKLFRLLDGLPPHTVKVCPGCEKCFLNPTLREKNFCSPRCMWRVNTAKRREADREGYNEYQAKLMKDRYREKNGHPRLKTKSRKAKKGE